MMANKFAWEIDEFSPLVEGYVQYNLDDPSKIESGAIHLNQHFIEKPDYTYNNLIFIICHELLHILNKDGIRRGDRKWNEWNTACDHVIEVFLRKMSDIIKPYNNQYNIIEELYNHRPDCTSEYAYDWIIKHPSSIKFQNIDNLTIQVTDGSGNYLFTVTANLGGITSELDPEEAVKTLLTDQLISEARAIFENIKAKGNSPGYLTTYLDKILKVEIPWQSLVEKAIKTNVIMKPDERTWRCLNKFYLPHNIHLPGYAMSEDTEGTGTLIVLVDSSNSISDKNLKQFSHIIENSMKYFKVIVVLVHDIHIHQRKQFDKDSIREFYTFISKEGYHGRGGTSHTDVFKEIQTEYWEKNKDDLSMVISLTDNYSDIEYNYKQFEWLRNNLPLTIIISKGGKLLNLDQSFGSITQIKINS